MSRNNSLPTQEINNILKSRHNNQQQQQQSSLPQEQLYNNNNCEHMSASSQINIAIPTIKIIIVAIGCNVSII